MIRMYLETGMANEFMNPEDSNVFRNNSGGFDMTPSGSHIPPYLLF